MRQWRDLENALASVPSRAEQQLFLGATCGNGVKYGSGEHAL